MKRVSLCFATALLFSTCGCARLHSAEPIEAWVIDEETGEPIEGAVVVAHWQSEIHTMGGRIAGKQVMVVETVSDVKGRFHFSAWGPKVSASGAIEEKSPELLLFKPGYEYRRVANEIGGDQRNSFTRRSSWNAKKISLKRRLAPSAEELGNLNSDLRFIVLREVGACNWRSTPKTILAVQRYRRALAEFGQPLRGWETVDQELVQNAHYYSQETSARCGRPQDVIKGLQ